MVGVVIRQVAKPLHQVEDAEEWVGGHDVTEKPFVMRGVEVPLGKVFGPQGFV